MAYPTLVQSWFIKQVTIFRCYAQYHLSKYLFLFSFEVSFKQISYGGYVGLKDVHQIYKYSKDELYSIFAKVYMCESSNFGSSP